MEVSFRHRRVLVTGTDVIRLGAAIQTAIRAHRQDLQGDG